MNLIKPNHYLWPKFPVCAQIKARLEIECTQDVRLWGPNGGITHQVRIQKYWQGICAQVERDIFNLAAYYVRR